MEIKVETRVRLLQATEHEMLPVNRQNLGRGGEQIPSQRSGRF